jgi:1-deoxy-D-xylulose-5-phosphate reductoisomerase
VNTYISAWPPSVLQDRFPRRVAVLGCTGSIGVNALKVVALHPDLLRISALAAGRNATLLAQQAAVFRPPLLAVLDEAVATTLRAALPSGYSPEILVGPAGYETVAAQSEADVVLSSIVGAAGFPPTLASVRAGKIVALANKESLVLGGHLIRAACRATGAVILPVDSEHNALFQGLLGHGGETPTRLILTASGGPFRGRTREELAGVTAAQALNHPNWCMGPKVSIDSATLMNKGLEIIEACHLYGLPAERVDAVVHPQSIVHSLVEYADGSQIAHLSHPDMRLPIAHCLCFPRHLPLGLKTLDLARVGSLTFEEPDDAAFPCLGLAKAAYAAGESHPIVLNAVNEIAVERFLAGAIGFLDIPRILEKALSEHQHCPVGRPEDVLSLDRAARARAFELL